MAAIGDYKSPNINLSDCKSERAVGRVGRRRQGNYQGAKELIIIKYVNKYDTIKRI